MRPTRKSTTLRVRVFTGALLVLCAGSVWTYPLDGAEDSGIQRLRADQHAPEQPPGAQLQSSDLQLHLLQHSALEFDAAPMDPLLNAGLTQLLKSRDPSYAVVLVDFSSASNVRWAALHPDQRQNPGSVGKVLCMLALFDALARAFPGLEDRQHILKTTEVPAGDWVRGDSHDVPRFNSATSKNRGSILVPDDRFVLAEWVDHAISASANGAGNVIWREAMLLRHFGADYPISDQVRTEFFRTTSKAALSTLAQRVIAQPLASAGLDHAALNQGSFWTAIGKTLVPGGQSYATPRALARFMLRMEQGRLVDPWSSLAMKKFLYITKRRYRYVYAPELRPFATFFKSGSLYTCQPEEGFRCGKYLGNVRNLMNSVTTVEALPRSPRTTRYTVALMSNVLRVNSAWDHSRIAAAIHQLLTTQQPVTLQEKATERELSEAGGSD